MPNTIAENLARLQAAKTAIANAITAKGGTVGSGDGLEEFPTDISTISTGVDPEPEIPEEPDVPPILGMPPMDIPPLTL